MQVIPASGGILSRGFLTSAWPGFGKFRKSDDAREIPIPGVVTDLLTNAAG